MEIVQAKESDLPQIVELLKLSLGDSLIPKSEEYFSWKHFKNPFGKSFLFLAKENEELIGVRAFMQWKFKRDLTTVTAVRAVDTATHPDHQGKGIFKKLTLHAVDVCKDKGVDMVFNSPNSSSRPGYLKMGWKDNGKMPLLIGPGSIFPAFFNQGVYDKYYDKYSIITALDRLSHQYEFPNTIESFYTPISLSYFAWRYKDCPVARYGGIIEKDSFGIIFRLKPISKFIELRICDVWAENEIGKKKLEMAVKDLKRTIRPLLVSCAPTPLAMSRFGLYGPYDLGPNTTIRPLAMSDLSYFRTFMRWEPSIGTMELF